MYSALMDNDGNEVAADAERKAVIQMEPSVCDNEDDVAVCSFRLSGCCNPDGDWINMGECPNITVERNVEPIDF